MVIRFSPFDLLVSNDCWSEVAANLELAVGIDELLLVKFGNVICKIGSKVPTRMTVLSMR